MSTEVKKIRTASMAALIDISKYLLENNTKILTKKNQDVEIWTVTPKRLFTKEQRRLNKKLGIHKINYK